MSRFRFLPMKDDDYWDSDEPPPRENGDVYEKENSDKWEEGEGKKEPTKMMAVGERNPFQGDCGGFSRTNASTYYDNNEDNNPFQTPKGKNRRRPIRPTPSPPVCEPRRMEEEPVAPVITHLKKPQLNPGLEKFCQDVDEGYAMMKEMGIEDNLPSCRSSRHSVCVCYRSKWYEQQNPWPEMYSRKVFIGGLPGDVKEDGPGGLQEMFGRFGDVAVDWPSKGESPKGYVFLVFSEESAVHRLVAACVNDDERLFLRIYHNGRFDRMQVRPWRLADADFLVDPNMPVDPKYTLFVGGVPRPIRAVELAHLMERLYGTVLVAGIDIDVEFKYPKGTGAGRVVFESLASYRRAVGDRFALLGSGESQRRVELKPYVLDDMVCEECRRAHAPFFCPDLDCLQYYCEACWMRMHLVAKRENHTPLVKDA